MEMLKYSKCTKLQQGISVTSTVYKCLSDNLCLKIKSSSPTELSIFINNKLVKKKLVLQIMLLFSWYVCRGFLNVSWSFSPSEDICSLFQLMNFPYWKWGVNYYNYFWIVNLHNLNCIHSLWKAEADIYYALID